MKRRSWLWVVLVLLWAPAAGWAEEKASRLAGSQQEIERLLRTDYYGVYMQGKKIGWASRSLARVSGEQGGYVSREEVSLKMASAGAKNELRFMETQEFDAQAPYAFRGGLSRQTDGRSVAETRMVRSGKGFDVVIRAGDETVRKQIAALDYTLTDLTTVQLWIRGGPKKGDTITVRSLDIDELKTNRQVCKLAATKTSVADGVKVTYHEVEVTMPKEAFTGLERYDEKGEQVLSMNLAGLFDLRVEPEKVAKNTEFSSDLFALGTVKVDRTLGDQATIESVVLETVGKQELRLKSGACQAVARNDSGTYTLKLGKAYGVSVKATPQEIEEGLAETASYPISHARIQALAKEAVGDARTAEEKVKRLVRFVSGYITPSYTVQPLTVMDIVKVRKGDCSEYALLFTTLARAVGVPARDVGGLAYMGDEAKAFGLHAWNEVVLGGQWVPVDASADETEISPTHISFGSMAGDLLTNMLAAFSQLSFRVVEVRHRS